MAGRWARKQSFYLALLTLCSCTMVMAERHDEQRLLRDTLSLAQEVKEFEKTLGIEPTEALVRSSQQKPVTSMLWVWLQKLGTIATDAPIDARIGIKFSLPKEQIPLEEFYRAPGYSHYYRRGNQFGDEGSVITLDFAQEKITAKVKIIIHEDLHDARNFDLPWEEEEALITPIGMLAAREFLLRKGDPEAVSEINRALEEERRLSRELMALVHEAQRLFASLPLLEARTKVTRLLASYPVYNRYYRYQTRDQDEDLVLEAKLSHDFAYYRYFDRLVSLSERIGDLKVFIAELKEIARATGGQTLEQNFQMLESKYAQRAAAGQGVSPQLWSERIKVSK